MDEESSKREFLVTFADFKNICIRSKRVIIASALLGAFLAATYSLMKPLEYEVKATYKEKGRTKSGTDGPLSLSNIFGGTSSMNQSEAKTLMASRSLAEELVVRLNLHAPINPKKPKSGRLQRIRDNLKVEYALLRNYPKPNIADHFKVLKALNVNYSGELPTSYDIACINDEEYDLYDKDGNYIGRKHFFEEVVGEEATFTVAYDREAPLPDDLQTLTLLPIPYVANGFLNKIGINPDPKDKTLLNLSYRHSDRKLAADVLNTTMALYHEYLRKDQERISNEQIAYLEKRQQESNALLSRTLERYAKEQSLDMTTNGFPDVDSAMKFLASSEQEYKKKRLGLDLEFERLKNVTKAGYAYYDRYITDGDPAVINSLLHEVRALKQKGDSIRMALQSDPRFLAKDASDTFFVQMQELDEVQDSLAELRAISFSIEKGRVMPPSDRLLSDSTSSMKGWYEKLLESKELLDEMPLYRQREKQGEWTERKEQFLAYLGNLIHSFEVREKTVKERLTHQSTSSQEFGGIDLQLAHDLFLAYQKELNEIEGKILQNQFVIDNLQDEEFELSGLSTIAHDPITTEIIGKYSRSLLALKDEVNRSSKEQERIRQDLLLHRGFLEMHLTQAVQVLTLRQGLLRDKLFSLQNATFDLVQQKVSIIEQQLSDYIGSRLLDINKEKEVIDNQLGTLRHEMATLPKRWIAEQCIRQQMETSQRVGKDIAHLVESKNINNNLEVIQSSPVDIALVPLYPKRPYPLLYAMLGAAAFAFLSTSSLLFRSVVRGLLATADNLKEIGFSVAGTLTPLYGKENCPLHDDDLATMRRLLTELMPRGEERASLLVLGPQGPDCSSDLATLALKRGLKVIVIDTSFDREEGSSGLLSYLEGSETVPEIHLEKGGYSLIKAGGCSRFGSEHVTSKKFEKLLELLSKQYDWILVVSRAKPTSAEVQGQLFLYSRVALSLQGERLEELRPILNSNKAITFIFPQI